jgi:hypothetical protein
MDKEGHATFASLAAGVAQEQTLHQVTNQCTSFDLHVANFLRVMTTE